jgi:putative methyltransferase (TIGR04325 family)
MTQGKAQALVPRHRALIRHWIPQGLRDLYNRAAGRAIRYRGVFPDWPSAVAAARTGYAETALVQRLERAALAVKRGEAAWEQDGVVHDHVPEDFPLVSCLTRVALAKGKLRVVDYGGALGSSYHQCRALLPELGDVHWTIVEQAPLVASGKQYLETAQLRFEETLDACVAHGRPDVVLLSGVLQYLPEPYALLEQIARLRIEYLILDRNAASLTSELITVQVLPRTLYPASYPSWLFDCERLNARLGAYYERLAEWEGKDPPIYGRGIGARFRGSFWRLRAS